MAEHADLDEFRREMVAVLDATERALTVPDYTWKDQLQGLTFEVYAICQFLIALAVSEAEAATHLSRNGVCRHIAEALDDKSRARADPTSELAARVVREEIRRGKDNPTVREGHPDAVVRGAYFEALVVAVVGLRDAWKVRTVAEVLDRFRLLAAELDLRRPAEFN